MATNLHSELAGTVALTVNGEAMTSAAGTLSQLLTELGYGNAKVATALNGDFVPSHQRDETKLVEHDEVEIVAPRQGG